jgi:copper homeostasis protein
MTPVLLEVAVASVDDALVASEYGARRLELNSALELHGLTPSLGLLKETRQTTTLPLIVMLRPRPGGFAYSPAEFRTMRQDCDLALTHGAAGVAFGLLHSDGGIDRDRCAQLLRQIGQAQSVFHRAFDLTPDPFTALERLIDLGVTRILTSGAKPTALEGADTIARLQQRSAGRIEILPGGGVRAANALDLLRLTGCNQLHGSFSEPRADDAGVVSTGSYRATSAAAVRAVSALLEHAGLTASPATPQNPRHGPERT